MTDKFLLKAAVDALTVALNSSNTPFPIDENVIKVIPTWNKLFHAIVDEGKELYFTVEYGPQEIEKRRLEALANKKSFYVTKIKGRFKEISNIDNMTNALYKYEIENVEYISLLQNTIIEPELKPEIKVLYTWIALYEFLANLLIDDVKWEIL